MNFSPYSCTSEEKSDFFSRDWKNEVNKKEQGLQTINQGRDGRKKEKNQNCRNSYIILRATQSCEATAGCVTYSIRKADNRQCASDDEKL